MSYETYLGELVEFAKSEKAKYWLELAKQFEVTERRHRENEK